MKKTIIAKKIANKIAKKAIIAARIALLSLLPAVSAFGYAPSAEIPGGLSAGDTPQFILITIDDALNGPAYDYTEELLGYGHRNPNGAPIPVTYYINTDNTDYHLVQQRHAQRCEIAVHTMTHDTSTSTDYDTWRAEILGAREALSELAQIPADEIVGFRAPYLAYSDASFNVLNYNEFLYESSITEDVGGLSESTARYIWPYTLDNTDAQAFDTGEGPEQPYANVWEVPMWMYYQSDGSLALSMDYVGGEDELLTMFQDAFQARHGENGNRAPMGIFLHPGWFADANHVNALNAFIEWALLQEDVWVVTNRQLIEWMEDPRPASEMIGWEPVEYSEPASASEIADGWDNDGDGEIDEETVNFCSYDNGSRNFSTNEPCPAEYPAPNVVETKVIAATVGGETELVVEEDVPPAWNPATIYGEAGHVVSHDDHAWENQWWTQGNRPGQSAVWEDLGSLVEEVVITHGEISPMGEIHVPVGDDETFTFTPDTGYQVSEITVDGVGVALADSYTFTNVSGDHTIVVDFIPDGSTPQYTITATAAEGGTIDPAGEVTVVEGTDRAFVITADSGYAISDVRVDGGSVGAVAPYTFTDVTQAHSIEAFFSQADLTFHAITVTTTEGGSVSPAGPEVTVEEGADQSFAFTAEAGYEIHEVLVDGESQGQVAEYTFGNVTGDRTLQVIFAEQAASGGICDGVADWDATQRWTEYSVGDRRVNDARLWECINPGFCIHEPSGQWGIHGWDGLGGCE